MVIILKELADKIENHGMSCYPEECCGIILGKTDGGKRIVSDVFELHNYQEENRRRRFFVTPGEYMRAERIATEKGLELLGFYHSHPDHPAIPSEFDREHALPWFTYVVLAVDRGEAKVMTAWELSESRDKFLERHLSVEQNLRDSADVGKRAGPV
jgi:proteasome lid subunit RPN8/RPN11